MSFLDDVKKELPPKPAADATAQPAGQPPAEAEGAGAAGVTPAAGKKPAGKKGQHYSPQFEEKYPVAGTKT